jgi:hypothetical protein
LLAGVCLAVGGAVGLGPPPSAALAQSAASASPVNASTTDPDVRVAQAGILHLTGLLSQARRSLDGTVGAHRAALEQAIATLSEARTGYALALRDLTTARGVSGARVSEDLRAAEALARQGERMLAQARTAASPATSPATSPSIAAPSVAAPVAPRAAPMASAGAGSGRDHLPAPAIPSLAASGAPVQPQPVQSRPQAPPTPAPPTASAQAPAPLLPQAAPPQTAAVAAPARPVPQVAPQVAPQPRPTASLPPPDVPEPPGTVTFKANDDAPPAGGEAGSSAALAAEVAGTLPERSPVQMTGEAALPPPSGATGPFRAGGAADWTPDRTPVPRPQGDASVRVDTAQAPPRTPYPPATARAEAVPSQPASLAPPQTPAAPRAAPPQVAAAPSAPSAPSAPTPTAPVRVEPPGVPAPPPGTTTLDPGLTVPPPSLTDPRQIAQVPATPDPAAQVDRPTLPDERLVAYAQNYPLRRRSLQLPPPGAPLPRPQPGLALERPPGLAPTEPPAGPPPAPGPGMAPSAVPAAAPEPAGTAASAATAPPPPQSVAAASPPPPPASGVTAATPARTTSADRLLSDESRDQFAEIRSQVGAQQQQAREILRQIDPVRTDLTRRMNGLPDGDPRRGGMAQVRDMINGAEVELKAALDGYGALLRQLDFVLADTESGRPSGWTPTDAARQAISASKRANAGVNGLKTAMAQFERVMTQSQ